MHTITPAAQASELLKEIAQQTDAECRAARVAAEGEAAELVAKAHQDGRRDARDALGELRREGALRLTRAKAQIETESRRRAQRLAGEVIERAWPMLADALLARWQDPALRRKWIEGAGRQARARIQSDTWTVEHPPDWSPEEERQFRSTFEGTKGSVDFVENSRIKAGLRIAGANARLDATPDGFLADPKSVAAQLLAELGDHG